MKNNDTLLHLTSVDIETIKKEVPFCQNDLVFAGGSIIEGIGNNLSDIDIFVVTDEFDSASNYGMDYDFKNVKFMFKRINGINCDIEYWPRNVIDTIFKQINSLDLMNIDTRVMNQIQIPNYDFTRISSLIHRMINGLSISNETQFNYYVQGLDLKKYHTLMIRYNMSNAESKYDDIVGNLEAGNYSTSLFAAKEYLVYISMSLLHAYSISIDRKKWLFKKLELLIKQNPELEDMVNEILSCYFGFNISGADMLETAVEQMVQLTEDIYDHITKKLGGI